MTKRVPSRSIFGRRCSADQKGFVVIEFLMGVGFLLIPVAFLVMAFPTWAERQTMARTAARESARVFALTADPAKANATITEIETNYGVDPGTMTLELSDFPAYPIQPGDVVVATIKVEVPALNVGLLEIDQASFTLSEVHSEPVDTYRSRPAS